MEHTKVMKKRVGKLDEKMKIEVSYLQPAT
jgi:hypothetical protein